MRRLLCFSLLLFFAVPFGISISGCSKASSVTYCNGSESGPVLGQITTINLGPRQTGLSLNQGQIGSIPSPSATDCRSQSVSAAFVYGTTDPTLVDVQPSTGNICAGTFNRNTGGGIPDYTVCTPNGKSGVANVTASAGGATSNPIPVFVHPVVTSIELGPPTTNCTTDPASSCIDLKTSPLCGAAPLGGTPYAGDRCLSQGQSGQLTARSYAGAGASRTNISCLVGPVSFSAQNTGVVSIDQNGLATAVQPGSTLVNANIAQSSSSTGFFSTCPPASILLTTAGSTTAPAGPVRVTQNTQQNLVVTVIDTKGNPITNLPYTVISTNPQTIPAGGGIVTPTFPGSAAITAVCQPPACNGAPFADIGLFGNGVTATSNPVVINAVGTSNSTVLYVASTNSQYLQPYDFTTTSQSAPVRLPYVPNSMVITQDSSVLYLGSATELIAFNAASNQVLREDPRVPGTVLAVSPDGTTVVIADPTRKLTYLYSGSGSVTTEYGGVGTRAQFSADSQTVYITTNDSRLLVYSQFIGWTEKPLTASAPDVTVTIPNAGAYLGGNTVTGRTNCPNTTSTPAPGNVPPFIVTNEFYPLADTTSIVAERLMSTNDGAHIFGASVATGVSDLGVSPKNGVCPPFTSSTIAVRSFAAAMPTAITSVLPTTDSAFGLVTYLGTGGVVPQYTFANQTLKDITLQTSAAGKPLAPVAGTISTDNQTVYVGTSGDQAVHQLTRGTSGFSDTVAPLLPNLPAANGGGIATPNLLVQRPRRATS